MVEETYTKQDISGLLNQKVIDKPGVVYFYKGEHKRYTVQSNDGKNITIYPNKTNSDSLELSFSEAVDYLYDKKMEAHF